MSSSSPVGSVKIVSPGNVHAGFAGAATDTPIFSDTRALRRFAAGEDPVLMGSVDDAIKTMALTEACYRSSERGGTPIPAWE